MSEKLKVRIYNPDTGFTKYGNAEQRWFLKVIEDKNKRTVDPIMGWATIEEPNYQVKLRFDDKEKAIEYAKSKGYDYIIQDQKQSKIRKKSYSENFLK